MLDIIIRHGLMVGLVTFLLAKMILSLIFSMSILTLVHYFGLEDWIVLLVNLPIEVYLCLLILLLVIKVGNLIVRWIPAIRGFYKSMSRITSRIDNLSSQIEKSQNGPFKNGQKRSLSTNVKPINPLSKKEMNGSVKTLSRQLTSRRVKGLFASILEYGSMVSLATVFSKLETGFESASAALAWQKEEGLSDDLMTKVVRNEKGSFDLLVSKMGTVADLITGFGWRIISACFPNKVKFTSRLRLLNLFSSYIWRMYKTNGAEQVVKYLKAAQLATQKAIGKDKIQSMRELDKSLVRSKLTSSGLPVIIPSRDRKLIMGGSTSIIRFWLTLFSIYRVISIPGTLKLQTIIDPLDNINLMSSDVVRLFNTFIRVSSVSAMFKTGIMFKEADLLLLESASSTKKVAWSGYLSDPSLHAFLGLSAYARNILNLLGQYRLLLLYDGILAVNRNNHKLHNTFNENIEEGTGRFSHSQITSPKGRFAGKLSVKEEAAGKMRVFAMVDVWSQTILKPIEQMLAVFLKGLPNDGVYNQHASELRARQKSINYGCSYGYDLSAATDRLPLGLQSAILNLIIPDLGDNWALFLTRRDYHLYLPASFAKEIGATIKGRSAKAPNSFDVNGQELPIYYDKDWLPWTKLRYAAGQPMGALSSFAMLAVTHHLIAQLSYRIAYNVPLSLPFSKDTWYVGYECTGDDIIIFDALVAKEYLNLMSAFGVPINTTKSVVSKVPVTEYLKVTSLNGINVGAISWKMFMSGNSLMGRVNIIYHFLSKGIISKNINPWIERTARISLYNKNSNLTPTLIAIWTMLSNRNLISVEEAMKALIGGKDLVFRFAKAILMNADVNKITLALPQIFTQNKVNLFTSKRVESIWKFEKPWFGITMWKPLAVFAAKGDLGEDAHKLSISFLDVLLSESFLDSDISWSVDMIARNCTQLLQGDIAPGYQLNDTPDLPSTYVDSEGSEIELLEEEAELTKEVAVLFQHLFYYIENKVNHLGESLKEDPGLDAPLGILASQNDLLDRYNELLELITRFYDRIDPDKETVPPRVIKPTELKLIKHLQKMSKRPKFTTAYSLLN